VKKLPCIFVFAAVICFSVIDVLCNPLWAAAPPPGFKIWADARGGSVVTTSQVQGRTPAEALVKTLDRLSGYFDGRPVIVAAFQDKNAGCAQGTFMAKMGGQVVKGVATAQMSGRNAGVTVIYDRADRFAISFSRLTASPGKMASKPTVKLHRVSLPDGSGTVGLPDGWRITGANKGMMDAVGPDGCVVSLGIYVPIQVPGGMNIPGSENLLWAPYGPPAEAIFTVGREMQRVYGRSVSQKLRIIEQHPTPSPLVQGKAAFLHFTFMNEFNGRLSPCRGLAWVATAPTGPAQWMYYFSQVLAPDAAFARHLPAMLEIWKSWKVSDKVYQERLNNALANMREIGRIVGEVSARREQAHSDAHYNWIEYIRDERLMKDTRYDTYTTQSLHYVDKLVDKLNDQEGYNRYEAVPLREYYRTR